jgi:hypothetical protein
MSPVTAVNLLPVRNPRTGQIDRQIHPLSSLEIASGCAPHRRPGVPLRSSTGWP